ncbi:MAG: hypothetical protein FWG83_01485 [Oscillospiraceae bacterium]|nr:hypothetical protein [Oscillospiraceae bacterium]
MFEPISQSLYELMMFSVIGFFLGGLYEPLRIVRLFVKTGTVVIAIQDTLFLAISGLLIFAYSLEFGEGYFRYFYVAGVVFGASVYFLTAGKLISLIMGRFAYAIRVRILRPVKRLLKKLFMKIAQKIRQILVKLYKFSKKCGKGLKTNIEIKYNSMNTQRLLRRAEKISKRKSKKEESRNGEQSREGAESSAIRARVIRRTNKA